MNAKLKIKNVKAKMRSSLFVFYLAFSIFGFALVVCADSTIVSTATREGRLAVFDDAWETVRDRYYDPTFHGLDWQAERAKFRPLASEAQTTAELYSVLRRMLGSLRDAHTRVYAPDERFDWRHPRFISVGISVREIDGSPVIVSVERGSEAERAGLRAGDTIVSIDDEAALDVFARRLQEQAALSTPAVTRFQVMAKLFEGAADTAINISWIGADGRARSTRLRREWRERNTALRVRRVRGSIGIIELDVFTQSVAVDFVRALDGELRGVRGLVIDLRHNGGGDAEAMTEVASAFLPAGKSLGRFTDRGGRIQFEPHTRAAMLFSPDTIKTFNAPVIILTSERTSSAAEIFVAALKEARRGTVLGQTTCGCVLAIRRSHTLPDGGELDVSEMDYRTAGGARLEGAGLAPDEKITLDRASLRTRRDRAIERAIELLR
ncbi:MAG: carboxyl-terminal processing protease [Acidobacteriota bacterium]|jgi:carboxyl-terminal processing protease|nr:carboxyl-terminal processing protease [Acidobacteriota bacterium]